MSTFNILLQHLSFMGSYYGGWKLKTLTLFCLGGEKRSHPDSSVATADTLRAFWGPAVAFLIIIIS